jgi:hypothetical protein
MKKSKVFTGLLLCGGLFVFSVHAQVALVSAPLLEYLTEKTQIEQFLYQAQSLEELFKSTVDSANQFQNMLRAEQRALQNLSKIGEVKSFNDFMGWYNRQLYLEKAAEERFGNMGIKVGGRNYRFTDVEAMTSLESAVSDKYKAVFDWEMTPEERKAMWLGLGMSPSNYAYVQTWKTRDEELVGTIMTKLAIVNEENMEASKRNKEHIDAMAADQDAPEDEKMGEKDLLRRLLEVTIDTNEAARQANLAEAQHREWLLVQEREKRRLDEEPRLSETWGRDDFLLLNDFRIY